jgi:anti-sigma regulatory factor (Ser/Thr protein kinase)
MQERLTVEMPVKPESAGWSREALAEFRDRLGSEAFIDLQLVVSELVADAVRTDETNSDPIVLQIELDDECVRVAVSEGAAAYELRSRRPDFGQRGWGVYLARILGQRWGSSHEGTRGCVWVQVPLTV